jgi:hypothetical protein
MSSLHRKNSSLERKIKIGNYFRKGKYYTKKLLIAHINVEFKEEMTKRELCDQMLLLNKKEIIKDCQTLFIDEQQSQNANANNNVDRANNNVDRANQKSKKIVLTISTVKGRKHETYKIEATSQTYIRNLKKVIEDFGHVKIERLIFRAKTLDDNSSLGSNNIIDGSHLSF